MITFESLPADLQPDLELAPPGSAIDNTRWTVGACRYGIVHWVRWEYGEWTTDPTRAGLFELERAETLAHLATTYAKRPTSFLVVPESALDLFRPVLAYTWGRPRTDGENVRRTPPALIEAFTWITYDPPKVVDLLRTKT